MNILERFKAVFSVCRITELEAEIAAMKEEIHELKTEHTAEIADLVRRHRASMQQQSAEYCAGLDELSKSLAQLQCKEASDGGNTI
jgi:DNA mismatch repair ATPase MutS